MLRQCIDTHANPSVIYSGSGNERVESNDRTSSTAILKPEHHPLVIEINTRIAQTLNLPVAFGEVLQGQRYAVGQEFIDHTDYFKRKWYHWRRKGQRTWSFMIYLNGDCQGGATEFSFLERSFSPREGMASLLEQSQNQRMAESEHSTCGPTGREGDEVYYHQVVSQFKGGRSSR